jgi:hypothetical protein
MANLPSGYLFAEDVFSCLS